MAYKQLIYPNLDDNPKKPLYIYVNGKICTNWVGWCLAVVKASYGATKSMGCAWNAWVADNTKHTNYDLPEGVYVPVWWKGGKEGYGHVAIAKRSGDSVKVWSSPYKKSATFTTFSGSIRSTLDGMTRTYGCSEFVGWSEKVCEKRVVEYVAPAPTKSNEEICKEVWEGKWGTGKEREKRLTDAGYDYATIQKMVDAGVGKPTETKPEEPKKDEDKKEESKADPEPTPEPVDDEKQEEKGEESVKEDDEIIVVDPAKSQDADFIGDIIETASEGFDFNPTVKFIAYLVGDALLVGALLVPDIVNTIQAPNASVWAEYCSKVLLEAGIAVLTVFKLFKRKK